MSDLGSALRSGAVDLSRRTIARMYENPFWEARFGARGRVHAEADGIHHVEHLAEAIDWEMPSVMIRYAQWLRPILVTRGMCTRHLEDTFTALAAAISERRIDSTGTAAEYLRAARESLLYPSGAAREIQDGADEIADRATDALYRRHPQWEARWGPAGRERCRDDLLYHLSYLADATAMDRPDLFAGYVAWIAGFLDDRGVEGAHMDATLAALERELSSAGSHLRAAVTIVSAARDEIDDRP